MREILGLGCTHATMVWNPPEESPAMTKGISPRPGNWLFLKETLQIVTPLHAELG